MVQTVANNHLNGQFAMATKITELVGTVILVMGIYITRSVS